MFKIIKDFITSEDGNFWAGFAQAYKDSDEKKTKEKLIGEERAYDEKVREEDRAFQREQYLQDLQRRREEADLAHKRDIELYDYQWKKENLGKFIGTFGAGVSTSGGSGTGGAGASDTGGELTLKKLVTDFPGLDPEIVAEAAGSAATLNKIYNTLTKKREEFVGGGGLFTADMQNSIIGDVVSTAKDIDDVTDDEIDRVARQYGVQDQLNEDLGNGMTVSDVIAQGIAQGETDVIIDAIPDLLSVEERKTVTDMVSTRLVGSLNAEARILQQAIDEAKVNNNQDDVNALTAQLQSVVDARNAVETDGYLDEVINTPYGQRVMEEMWSTDQRIKPTTLFPHFRPAYLNEEEADAALESGFIAVGDLIELNGRLVRVQP